MDGKLMLYGVDVRKLKKFNLSLEFGERNENEILFKTDNQTHQVFITEIQDESIKSSPKMFYKFSVDKFAIPGYFYFVCLQQHKEELSNLKDMFSILFEVDPEAIQLVQHGVCKEEENKLVLYPKKKPNTKNRIIGVLLLIIGIMLGMQMYMVYSLHQAHLQIESLNAVVNQKVEMTKDIKEKIDQKIQE